MKKLILLSLVLALFSAGCSKMDRAKRAYRKGDYRKAQDLLALIIKVDSENPEAQKYLVLIQAGMAVDSAAQLIQGGDFAAAVPLLEYALGMNNKSTDANTLLTTALNSLTEKIIKEWMPAKDYGRVITLSPLVLKHRPSDPALNPVYVQAVIESEHNRFTWKSVQALSKAVAACPDNAWLVEKNGALTAAAKPFEDFFGRYRQALVSGNFGQWRSMVNANYIKIAEADLRRLKEQGEKELTSLDKYFRATASDPVRYGSTDGGTVVCVEPLSATQAFVHFTYPNLPKVLKMEITGSGSVMKIDRPEDSDIRKE